jgi:hypothetical protein
MSYRPPLDKNLVAAVHIRRHPKETTMRMKPLVLALALGVVGAPGIAAPALAASPGTVEHPPVGISPQVFATQYSGCLGPLRSAIAQGQFAGVGPFGEHFTGQVNPGAHQGTVGEEEFLETVIGIPADQLAAFCAQFE